MAEMPANYNDVAMVIHVDPMSLWRYGTTDMKTEMKAISDALKRIHETWKGLALGWEGKTADQAQDFSDRWNKAVTQLFGSDADPKLSVLNRMAMAVQTAAMNYGATEDVVLKMFNEFDAGLQGSGPAQPPTRDQDLGPITENAQW